MVTRGGAARRTICTANRTTQILPGRLQPPDLGDAGWSSPVARQAHNLKVAGSNPAPATNKNPAHAGFFAFSLPKPLCSRALAPAGLAQ